MSLEFQCPRCGNTLITRYLKPHEEMECYHCTKRVTVPDSAMPSEKAPPRPGEWRRSQFDEARRDGLSTFSSSETSITSSKLTWGIVLLIAGLLALLFRLELVSALVSSRTMARELVFGGSTVQTAMTTLVVAGIAMLVIGVLLLVSALNRKLGHPSGNDPTGRESASGARERSDLADGPTQPPDDGGRTICCRFCGERHHIEGSRVRNGYYFCVACGRRNLVAHSGLVFREACPNCHEHLILDAKDMAKGRFSCPQCQAETEINPDEVEISLTRDGD